MACIRLSYCYVRQKSGSSISAGSFIALISQSNAVGSITSQCASVTFPRRYWRHAFLLRSQASFTRSQSSPTSLSCQANIRESRRLFYVRGCNFFKSQNKQHAYLLHVQKMQNVCLIWPTVYWNRSLNVILKKVWKWCAFTLMQFK